MITNFSYLRYSFQNKHIKYYEDKTLSKITFPENSTDYRDIILTSLDDDQAENIITLDLQGKTALTDYMFIASGRSKRHVNAIAHHLLRHLKEEGIKNAQISGIQNCDWVLIDIGDAIIHIFRPEVRQFYNLEQIWNHKTSK